MNYEAEEIQVVELSMMDKRKYFPLTLASGLYIRCLLYPVSLIKTRLQIQKGRSIYNGTFDAFVKIAKSEGVKGLYRGFWINCLQLIPSLGYISTYEGMRHHLKTNTTWTNNNVRSFISGGAASIVGQTLAVPLDIVNQHIMLLGQKMSHTQNADGVNKLQKLNISENAKRQRFGAVSAVIKEIHKRYGLLGFYRGYFVSLTVFAPNSALWWYFYDKYSELLASCVPASVPRLLVQVISAPLGGVSSALITNPLDLVRARMQVDGSTFPETVRMLWHEERYRIVVKGLSARLVQSVMFSFFIILGYESIKRWSLLDEYKDQVRW